MADTETGRTPLKGRAGEETNHKRGFGIKSSPAAIPVPMLTGSKISSKSLNVSVETGSGAGVGFRMTAVLLTSKNWNGLFSLLEIQFFPCRLQLVLSIS